MDGCMGREWLGKGLASKTLSLRLCAALPSCSKGLPLAWWQAYPFLRTSIMFQGSAFFFFCMVAGPPPLLRSTLKSPSLLCLILFSGCLQALPPSPLAPRIP